MNLKLALSKGRILEDTLPLLAAAGIEPEEDPLTSRKLQFETNHKGLSLIAIRAADVPTFVEYGAADVGIAGKDVLMEHGCAGLYEPLDLNIAGCRLSVAGKPGTPIIQPGKRIKIATKYTETARRWFAERGQQVEIIKLYGSMELAPLVGLADLIVDLVDTGNTLKANGLVELEHMADISSRLVANKTAMKIKYDDIAQLSDILAGGTQGQAA